MPESFSKKVLCLGNNIGDTDELVSRLAESISTTNHGLVTDENFVPLLSGFYHTTIVDIPAGGIVNLAKNFDSVMMLDQPAADWSHWKLFLSTYRLLQKMEEKGIDTDYRGNKNIQKIAEFDEFLKTNKSFCIYPWISKTSSNNILNTCPRSKAQVTTLEEFQDWVSDPNYTRIREKMLAGELIPEFCKICYDHEALGVESYRTFETREWISKLDIRSIDDLDKITHPYFYELTLNNKCNINCRGCRPSNSSAIEQEYKKFNIVMPKGFTDRWEYSPIDLVDKKTLNSNSRVYFAGGEPTVTREVYQFMQDCIHMGKTDFELTLSTNAVRLSDKFLSLAEHFTNLHFSVSLDGYGRVNDYWRWGSDWDTVIKNTKELKSRGHAISINSVPGIYNVTNFHLLLEFLDREFPFAGLYLQINYNNTHSAFNHPNAELVLESMERCRKTRSYSIDGKSVKTTIDSIYDHYSKSPLCNLDDLREFFNYNDQLDRARNVKLGDYIPELEACRKLILPS